MLSQQNCTPISVVIFPLGQASEDEEERLWPRRIGRPAAQARVKGRDVAYLARRSHTPPFSVTSAFALPSPQKAVLLQTAQWESEGTFRASPTFNFVAPAHSAPRPPPCRRRRRQDRLSLTWTRWLWWTSHQQAGAHQDPGVSGLLISTDLQDARTPSTASTMSWRVRHVPAWRRAPWTR